MASEQTEHCGMSVYLVMIGPEKRSVIVSGEQKDSEEAWTSGWLGFFSGLSFLKKSLAICDSKLKASAFRTEYIFKKASPVNEKND